MARQPLTHAVTGGPDPDPSANGAGREAPVESYRRLAEVFHHVLSEQSLDTLLDRVADTLAELVPYDALHIYEADAARRELVPVLVRSEWEKEIMRTRPAFGQGITGWAAVNNQPVLSNDAHLDPRVAFVPGTPVEPEALISIPLIARGALKGALNIYRLGEEASFEEAEFELAKWFGDAAALALDNAQVRARLEHQAQTDSLTGLFNHRSFHERLRAELTRASRVRDSVALLMFDIDDFKRVNDICGHAVGDQILVALAETVHGLVRSSDVVCRIGGDEFAVIMPSCNAGDALGLARRLMERLEAKPIDAAGEITLSVGIAQGPDHAGNPRELVACAETAMMTAKARGKSRIVLFSDQTAERPGRYASGRDVRSVAHLKMLQSLANKLNRLNDVREIGEAIVSELRMLIDYHSCRVYAVEGEQVLPIAVRGDVGASPEEYSALRVRVGEGITGHVAATGRSLLVPNALECELSVQIPATEPIDESVIAAALRYESNVIGVVFLSKLGVDQFDESDLRLLEVLAGYASVALENARLYDSLRREAENAKAWLEFADAMSATSSFEEIADKTVRTVARLMEATQCSLWLENPCSGDFQCAASVGYLGDPGAEPIARARITAQAADAYIRSRKTSFVMTADELREWFFRDVRGAVLSAVATAPLQPGYGVKGWITVGAPGDDADHFTGERLSLLEGLSYRASMALQKALLHSDQQDSVHVATALLEFARALADVEGLEETYDRIVERSGAALGTDEVALWLQDPDTSEMRPVAFWGGEANRAEVMDTRYPPAVAEAFIDRPGPFVLTPDQYRDIPGAVERGHGRHYAVAPFRFDGGRMGFLVAGARPEAAVLDDSTLRMIAGLADQAKLALSPALGR